MQRYLTRPAVGVAAVIVATVAVLALALAHAGDDWPRKRPMYTNPQPITTKAVPLWCADINVIEGPSWTVCYGDREGGYAELRAYLTGRGTWIGGMVWQPGTEFYWPRRTIEGPVRVYARQ